MRTQDCLDLRLHGARMKDCATRLDEDHRAEQVLDSRRHRQTDRAYSHRSEDARDLLCTLHVRAADADEDRLRIEP